MNISKNIKFGILCVSQRPHLENVLKTISMHDVKHVQSPLDAYRNISLHDYPNISEEIEYISRVSYSSIVGFVMFAMVCMWLDLACKCF